jgi:PIN domain nuclease of toxin-antitoxin system
MQLLIDTHVLIWFLEGNKLLSRPHRQIISDSQNDVFVSIASLSGKLPSKSVSAN